MTPAEITIGVTDAADARKKARAAKVLGLRVTFEARGTWDCTDGDSAFLGAGHTVRLERGKFRGDSGGQDFVLRAPCSGERRACIVMILTEGEVIS